MSQDIYDLNCPFCSKIYKLPRAKVVKHVGKTIYCRGCAQPFSVPPLPAFRAEDSFAGIIDIGSVAEPPEKEMPEETNGSALPPPFSAAVLPPISALVPVVDEPPTVSLPHVDLTAGADDDVVVEPYRKTREHGAVAVEELPPDPHANGSAFESSMSLHVEFPDPPAMDADEPDEISTHEVNAAGAASEELPQIASPAVEAEGANSFNGPQQNRVNLPPGFDLASLPVARAAPPPQPPVISIDLRPLRRRLTCVIVLCVIIVLLGIANLLATLGYLLPYLPHRPM